MKNYRLKPEAVPFFKEKYATAIYPYDTWEGIGVDVKALDEVKDAYISYGHADQRPNGISTSLGGWGCDEGSRFHFTLHFPSMKFMEHDKFSKGRITRELMEKIQKEVNYFYSQFINEESQTSNN